jgi:hypothetical protein
MKCVRHTENLQEDSDRQIASDDILEPITMNLRESDSEESSAENVCAYNTNLY